MTRFPSIDVPGKASGDKLRETEWTSPNEDEEALDQQCHRAPQRRAMFAKVDDFFTDLASTSSPHGEATSRISGNPRGKRRLSRDFKRGLEGDAHGTIPQEQTGRRRRSPCRRTATAPATNLSDRLQFQTDR